MNRQGKPSWAVEVKWSDRLVEDPRPLDPLIEFAKRHDLKSLLVTTRSKTGELDLKGFKIEFIPCALQAYILGRNIINSKFMNLA
jgi:hypothetical protein